MPKKKKKNRASGGGDGSTSLPKGTPQKQHASTLLMSEPEECLSLRLVPSTTPPVKVLRYLPMIVLHEDDADRLAVCTGDEAFVLTMETDSKTLRRSVLARIHVATSATTPLSNSFSTPTKTPRTKPQRSNLWSGRCFLFPQELAKQFMISPKADAGLVPATPEPTPKPSSPINTPSATPSSSKSKFSFARGGGGDKLISTPTHATSTSQIRTPKKEDQPLLWVVPRDSLPGDELAASLCHNAGELHVTVAPVDSKSVLQQSAMEEILNGTLGKQLLRAHLQEAHLSEASNINISVGGQYILCQVTKIVTEDTSSGDSDVDQLTADVARVAIDKEGDTLAKVERLIAVVQNSLRSADKSNALSICQVTPSTNLYMGPADQQKVVTEEDGSAPTPLVTCCDAVMEQVQSLLTTPILHPELFQGVHALRPPRGVLLFGPSGVGKSAIAQQIAQQTKYQHHVHVQSISCASLQSQTAIVGQAEKELVYAFEQARQPRRGKSGCLVLIDDVHLICQRRRGNSAGADRLSSTLLALLDGIEGRESTSQSARLLEMTYYPMVILATTANPTILDPALRRPGRLDAEVEVPLPDEPSTRSKILKFTLSSLQTRVSSLSEEEWIVLGRLAKGFTGADIKLAAKEAVRTAIFKAGSGLTLPVKDSPSTVDYDTLAQAIRSVKPSAIKAVTVEIPQVHWTSIGGMEEVKRQLREAIELPLTHSAMFQKLGIRPPRGVLLYGPPGCSKTLMARALATEGQMNFLAVKGPELLSKWLGESERALASLFRRARLASPSVIFFDEVDAIASKRGGGNTGGERLLSQLLTELDGVQTTEKLGKKQRVVIVCATNRPDLLDSALMRPGRIDRMIYVGVPDIESRKKIFEISLEKKSCANGIDVSLLAAEELSGGFSGAELVAACRDAALLALEDNHGLENVKVSPIIEMRHMLRALQAMERQITPDMIEFYTQYRGTSTNA